MALKKSKVVKYTTSDGTEFIGGNSKTEALEYENDFKKAKVLEKIEHLFHVSDLSLEISKKAVILKNRYKYSFWDSMILASALDSNCDVLYSEDMQDGQLIDGKLKIINPFKQEDELIVNS